MQEALFNPWSGKIRMLQSNKPRLQLQSPSFTATEACVPEAHTLQLEEPAQLQPDSSPHRN